MIAAPKPDLLRRIGAIATLGVIFFALAIKGADGAALAALFGGVLSLLLAGAILTFPAARLVETARRNRVTIAAALVFAVWSIITALPVDAAGAPDWWRALWHPFWAEFGTTRGAISLSPYRTLEGLAAFAAPAAAFALGALNTVDREDRDRLGRLMAATAIGISAISVFLHANGVMAQANRLSGAFNSPNSAATLLGVLTIMLCALLIRAARGRMHTAKPAGGPPAQSGWMALIYAAPVTLTALSLAIACMFLTGSRAGLTSLAGALLLFFALALPTTETPKIWGLKADALPWTVAAIAGFLFLVGGEFIFSRLVSLDTDAQMRSTMLSAHWNAFVERPLFGHGLNTFHEINLHSTNASTWQALHTIGAAHNIFVQALEETGLFGALLFALMLGPPLLRTFTIARTHTSGAEWAAATVAAFAFVFAHGMVDFGLQIPATAALLSYALGAYSGRVETSTAAEQGGLLAARLRAALEHRVASVRNRFS